jgi:hypothetical protein
MSTVPGQLALRMAARTVVAALLLAMTLQFLNLFLALSGEDRGNVWLTGLLCA